MPLDRRTIHSGPLTRNQLMHLNQYCASAGFPKIGKWDRSQFDDVFVVNGTVARTVPVDITVVCDLSSDSHFLRPQGTYNTNFMPSPDIVARKVKLQFTAQKPSTDVGLGDDYEESHRRLSGLQGEVAKTSDRRHFLMGDQMRLNYNLFEPKASIDTIRISYHVEPRISTQAEDAIVDQQEKEGSDTDPAEESDRDTRSETVKGDNSPSENTDEEDDAAEGDTSSRAAPERKPKAVLYDVPDELKEIWREIEKTHDNRIMPVYGINRDPIPYNLFPKFLRPGTTIIASFNLIHYSIKEEKRRDKVLFDSFVANVKEIFILNLHDGDPSRPLSTPKRKGIFVSQTPPTRATLRAAADAFFPAPAEPGSPTSHKTRGSKDKQRENKTQARFTPGVSNVEPEVLAYDNPVSIPRFPSLSDFASIAAAAIAKSNPQEADAVLDEELHRRLLPVIADYFRGLSADSVVLTPSADQATGATASRPSSPFVNVGTSSVRDLPQPAASRASQTVATVRGASDPDEADDFVHIDNPLGATSAGTDGSSLLRESAPNPPAVEGIEAATGDVVDGPAIKHVPERREARRRR